MLDIKVNEGQVGASFEGNSLELTADVLTIIHSVFHRLYHSNPIGAVMFREGVEHFMKEALTLSSEEVRSNE